MGERFGKYELVRRIGVGGMAEVFVARSHGAEGFVKDVVIKRILPTFNDDEDFVQMFVHEARLAARLRHANIVQIFDFDQVEGTYYIAMEWVDGADLRHVQRAARARRMPVPPRFAVHVGFETLKGLHYAHSRIEQGQPLGLVHRDISPHNVLVSFSGEVKITDFGVAKAAAMVAATRSGAIKGKLAYMSPEQARRESVDHRTDLYALGIVLWELLAGRRLFADTNTEGELLAAVSRGGAPPLSEVNAEAPEDFSAVVMRLLAPNPDDRYGSAAEALSAMGRFVSAEDSLQAGEYVSRLLPAEAEREQRGKTRASIAAVAAEVVPASADAETRPALRSEPGVSPPPLEVADEKVAEAGDESIRGDKGLSASGTGQVVHLPRAAGRRAGTTWVVVITFVVSAMVAWWFVSRRQPSMEHAPAEAIAGAKAVAIDIDSGDDRAVISVDGVPLGAGKHARFFARAPGSLSLQVEGEDGAVARRMLDVVPGHDVALQLRAKRASPVVKDGGADASDGQQAIAVTSDDGSATRAARGSRKRVPGQGMPSRRSAAHRSSRAAAGGGQTRARATKALALLDVVVSPWAEVLIDGSSIGNTPIKGYQLVTGRHRVVLRNPELKKTESFVVTLRRGERKKLRRRWIDSW